MVNFLFWYVSIFWPDRKVFRVSILSDRIAKKFTLKERLKSFEGDLVAIKGPLYTKSKGATQVLTGRGGQGNEIKKSRIWKNM